MPQVHRVATELKASVHVTGGRGIEVRAGTAEVKLQLDGGGLDWNLPFVVRALLNPVG